MSRATNRRLLDRKIKVDLKKPFELISEFKRRYAEEISAQERGKPLSCISKTQPSIIWSGE